MDITGFIKKNMKIQNKIYSCDHSLIMIDNTKHYNCSIMDENYAPVYSPLYLDI